MKVYLTSDHGGFELKKDILQHLKSSGVEVEDLGPDKLNPEDDYVDYAQKAAQALLAGSADDRVVMACRTGEGEAIAANRFIGIRAVIVWNEEGAKLAREKNDSNVLCLANDLVAEGKNLEILDTWLNTPFSGEERHVRRIKKLDLL